MDRVDYKKGIVNMGDTARMIRCMKKAMNGEKLTLAFLGGSITQGCLSSTPETCYAYLTYQWWVESFPQAQLTYVNAGIGGTTSHLGVGRVEEDVLSAEPDFVIVEYSVNDSDGDPHFQETYESLVRRVLSAKKNPALLLVHNVRYDDGENAEDIHRPVGAHYQLPSVSMKSTIMEKVKEGVIKNREITTDDLHPNDLGHAMVANVICYYLDQIKEMAIRSEMPKINTILPAPITPNGYENATRYRNTDMVPVYCKGFEKDETPQSCVADCFKKGYAATQKGANICFEVEGSSIAVQYRKTVRKPAPIAKLVIDGEEEKAVLLDANFEETWGDCLYLETVMEHGKPGKHSVCIEITETTDKDQESFYLVSLIVAG